MFLLVCYMRSYSPYLHILVLVTCHLFICHLSAPGPSSCDQYSMLYETKFWLQKGDNANDNTEVQMIFKDHYEQPYANKVEN
jgi:hypothetical protein